MNDLIDLNLIYQDSTLLESLINFFWALVVSYFVRAYYIYYAAPISNLGQLGNILPLLAGITFLVITIVKSSLALSLGLVGALSIVRFRSPIKEPEELVYIFLAIAIGLGCGAGKPYITAIVTLMLLAADMIRHRVARKQLDEQSLYVEFQNVDDSQQRVNDVVGVLKKYCRTIRITKMEINQSSLSIAALLDVESLEIVNELLAEVRGLDESAQCMVFDTKPVW